jgi:acyl-CoA thioester hydrolase
VIKKTTQEKMLMQDLNIANRSVLRHFPTDVRKEWIDRNEHMNNSFYLVATQAAYLDAVRFWRGEPPGTGRTEFGNFVTQSLVTYIREVRDGASLVIVSRLVAVDDKRLHVYAEMFDSGRNILCAAVERTSINVVRGKPPKVVPYPAAVHERLTGVQTLHASAPYADGREPVLRLNPRRPQRE